MLRIFVLLLLLINGLYYAWSHRYLQALGWAPTEQTEPFRLAQQLHPEALRRLGASELRKSEQTPTAPAAAPPLSCLKAGPFDAAQLGPLRSALESALPADVWTLEGEPAAAARWLLYMGKYANAEALAKKRAELAALGLKAEAVDSPTLQPGLSLGSYPTQAAAAAELSALSRRGVRTARVLQQPTEASATLLRLPAVDDALRAKLDALTPALAGKALQPC